MSLIAAATVLLDVILLFRFNKTLNREIKFFFVTTLFNYILYSAISVSVWLLTAK